MTEPLWAFPINWQTPLTETLEYRTEILTSRSGAEQRRALRNTPRRTLEFSALLAASQLRSFDRLMANAQNLRLRCPDYIHQVRTVTTMSSTDEVGVDDVPWWLQAGAIVALNNGDFFQVRTVESVAAGTVTFTTTATLPKGSRLYRTVVGFVEAEMRAQRHTSEVATVNARFSLEPTTEPARIYAPPAVLFAGLEVMTWQPNWSEGVDVEHVFPRGTLDYGRGRVLNYQPINFPTTTRRGAFLSATPGEVDAIKATFEAAKGRRGEFYLPTGQRDLVLAAPLAAGGLVLQLEGADVPDDTVHRHVAITMRDGTKYHRSINWVEPDGAETQVQLSAGLPETLTPENVAAISWMPRHRFASDSLTIEWVTDRVARCAVAVTSLENKTGL